MLYDIDSADLIDFAQRLAGLGDAVATRSSRSPRLVAEPGARADLNPNAIRMARERLRGMNEELDDAIEEYFALRAEVLA